MEYKLLDENFKAKLAPVNITGRIYGTAFSSGNYFCVDNIELLQGILGCNEYRCKPPEAFYYLFRRFGPPVHGYDYDKQICMYLLETPLENYYLGVSPSTGLCYRTTDKEIFKTLFVPLNLQATHPLANEIALATKITVADLLRPVFVRDEGYNIMGKTSCLYDFEASYFSPETH